LTFKNAIEEAIFAAAPDVAEIEVEGVSTASAPIMPQLVTLQPLNGKSIS
jgi:hypothetical protein